MLANIIRACMHSTTAIRRVYILAFIVALLPHVALAQSAPSTGPLTAGDIDDIQAKTFRQKALLALATVNDELAKKGAVNEGIASSEGVAPNCSEVYGSTGQYKVVFTYSDGSQVIGTKNDLIPGGWRVLDVSLDKVQLSRAGKFRDCGFSSTAPSAAKNNAANQSAQTYFAVPPPPVSGPVPPPSGQ
jgi:hypothetical protein